MLKVIDLDRSERGPQRLKSSDGKLLHCCCICGTLDTWGENWSTYCSERDLDESLPIPKFCSKECQKVGGLKARNVTEAMKLKAKNSEWREPLPVYRDATEIEKYRYALNQQRKP